MASRNPELRSIVGQKPRIVLLNKSDTADEAVTRQWIAAFAKEGIPAIAVDCKSGKGLSGVLPLARQVLKDKIAAWERKGMGSRPIRIMVVGIPNVGKSSLINRLAVSYTHLDVYKRQAGRCAKAPVTTRFRSPLCPPATIPACQSCSMTCSTIPSRRWSAFPCRPCGWITFLLRLWKRSAGSAKLA